MQTKKKVLIIDDDQDLLEIYGFKFESEGFSVEKAENGAWGLKRIQGEHFDIVLLDVSMPAMNGLEMLKSIEQIKKEKGFPKVLVLSNTALDSEVKEMEKAGADECFIKVKITPTEIYKKAMKLLGETK